jgi:hypothetical protein
MSCFCKTKYNFFFTFNSRHVLFFYTKLISSVRNFKGSILSVATVTTAWRVLGLRIEETASRYGGQLRIC